MSIVALTRFSEADTPGDIVVLWRPTTLRASMILLTVAACAGAGALGLRATAIGWDPDLIRLMRFMAALKGGLAALALAAGFWRLARPVAPWRLIPYLAGPAAMAGGAILLWQLQASGWAAIVLHVGLFGWLAAALTDEAFIPAFRLVRGRRAA